jgi:hypothetical protein
LVRCGNASGRHALVVQAFTRQRIISMGRPVVLGLGTLIILLLAVAFFF